MKIAAVGEVATEPRQLLTRHRVVEAAVELADRDGLEAVSMRRLADVLDVEAMSLYTHVRSKDDLLDAMVDAVITEIPLQAVGPDWRPRLRRQLLDARTVFQEHRWAPALIESRHAPGPATPAYFNTVIGLLRDGGFSLEQTHHALHVLGSRALGFAQDPWDDSDPLPDEAAKLLAEQVRDTLPYVAEMAVAGTHDGGLGGCDTDAEFLFALDFILDGLERFRR